MQSVVIIEWCLQTLFVNALTLPQLLLLHACQVALQTNLLLLIDSSSNSEKGNKEEKKIFFSNYEKVDGILVSKKVIIERVSISSSTEIVLDSTSHKIESKKTREVQEFILKEFKLNPVLKSEIFDFQKK